MIENRKSGCFRSWDRLFGFLDQTINCRSLGYNLILLIFQFLAKLIQNNIVRVDLP